MQTPTEAVINARLSIRIASDVVRDAERSLNPKAKWRKGVPATAVAHIDAITRETLESARIDLARAEQTLADALAAFN